MGDLKIANGLVCCGLRLFFDQFEFFLHSMSITVIIIKGRKLKLESQRNTSKPQHAYYTKEINSLSPNMKRYLKIFYHFPHSHDLYV